jgi:DNA-binding transcriptional MerR regulator
MTGYKTREVAELVGMSPPQVRAYARTGLLRPSRGPRRAYYFTFQDLVLLRTAKRLQEANVSARRVRRVLHTLSEQLPSGRSLTEVTIVPDACGIVANDQGRTWNPESGQLFLGFLVPPRPTDNALSLRSRSTNTPEGTTAEGFFQIGCELEVSAPGESREAYHKALSLDPAHAGAHVNLGRLDQNEGDIPRALDHYTAAIIAEPDHAIARFNVASAMEHLERIDEAIASYLEALSYEPDLSEAHYRLAVLYEGQGMKLDALRHLKHYRTQVQPS